MLYSVTADTVDHTSLIAYSAGNSPTVGGVKSAVSTMIDINWSNIFNLKNDVMFNSKLKSVEIPGIDSEELRKSTIERIEKITLKIIAEINSGNFPKITYCHHSSDGSISGDQKPPEKKSSDGSLRENLEARESNIANSFDSSKSLSWVLGDEEEQQLEEAEAGNPQVEVEEEDEEEDLLKSTKNSTTVDFRLKRSRKNLGLIITVMSHAHKMLINRTTRTRRSLYYELQSGPTAGLVGCQRILDDAVNHVASLLERAPWELGFTATSKGLVCGDLNLTFSGRDTVNCNIPGGLLIPQNIFRVTSARTTAEYVLVVEKDAVFQKLLEEDCANYLNCIIITGKGYPDVNTRMLVCLLGNKLNIPVYVLVDADPFGVEIMCIYRFGSPKRSRENQQLSCPKVSWLGIHPSEYTGLGISPKILTNADKVRLASLEVRSYVNERISNQLKIMGKRGKVDIEAVAGLSHRFLTTVYLTRKIKAQEFI